MVAAGECVEYPVAVAAAVAPVLGLHLQGEDLTLYRDHHPLPRKL